MKTISIPVHNRPELLKQVLNSIAAAEGHEDWHLVFSCEPSTQPFRVPFKCDCSTSINTWKRGCWVNTFLAADLAMTLGSTLNLYLEDDYLITPDVLSMVDQWEKSNNLGVLCLRRPHTHQELSRPDTVSLMTTGLFGCGFAWRSEMWPLIRQGWFAVGEKGYQMWDLSLDWFLREMQIPQWRPLVNRSCGIGLTGTHTYGDGRDLHLFGPAYDGPPIKEFYFV